MSLEEKILAKDIAGLGRAITLNESTRPEDNQLIEDILEKHSEKLNESLVISVSGIPGVGKSTFIEALGTYIHSIGMSLAVFTIDPSSERTHGSILGDKTRMNELSQLPNVFIRPSPSSLQLGGIGINTHKNIEIAKVAGYDIILVETVGVGQSETIVRNLSDLFILLLMPASGDELQGIKKGIMEVADFFIIHKADGDLEEVAKKSMKEVEIALHLTRENENISQQIFNFSSINKHGLEGIWSSIEKFIENKKATSEFQKNRVNQRKYWLEEEFKNLLFRMIQSKSNSKLDSLKSKIEDSNFISKNEILSLIKDSFPSRL